MREWLKQKRAEWDQMPIWERFFRTILRGGYVALLVCGFALLRPLACEPQRNEWTEESYQDSQTTYYGSKQHGKVFAKKKSYPEGHDANAYQKYRHDVGEIFCSEIKFTDILIAFFTYCLVVVGWFTLRSADENTKNAERAYLVAGPFFGIKNKGVTDDMFQNRPSKKMFHGPWRMIVTNFGRTAAYSTKIEWGICPFIAFKFGEKMADLLDKPEFAEWRELYMRPPDVFENIFGETNKHYQLRRIEIPDRDDHVWSVHFGRVKYKDVFGAPHYATFAYYMTEESSDAISPYLSKEHD